ncbi:MAG: hypothetical protein VXW32_04025 [Myxococcota bacterium]|nr:hypothetical protein [Myxococcota bacterium]
MAEMGHDAGVMAAVSRRVLLGLFLRMGILVVLLGGLGGLLALNSELSRASVFLPLGASIELFFMGLPEVLFHLVPVCAVASLIWTGAVLRESKSWMSMRLVGLGGSSLWLSILSFAAAVGVTEGLLGAVGAQDLHSSQQELLLTQAQVIPGQPVEIHGVEILAAEGQLADLREVRVSSTSPILRGAAARAAVEPLSGALSLQNGVLFREGNPATSMHFETFTLRLLEPPLGRTEGLKSSLEKRKRWTWPFMSVVLCLLVWPLALQGRSVLALTCWLGLWSVVRACDFCLPQMGVQWSMLIPPLLLSTVAIVVWVRWEDA